MDRILEERQEIIDNIKLIDCGEDTEEILKVLMQTDNDILKYITQIKVYQEKSVPNQNSWGTTTSLSYGRKLHHSKIELVASKFRSEKFFFTRTLKHEIGHVKGRMISPECGNSEIFANNYAKDPDNVVPSLWIRIKSFIFGINL